MPTFRYQHGDETHTIQLEPLGNGHYRATIGDRVYTFHASALENSGWLLLLEHTRHTVYTAAHKDTRYVSVDGHAYTLAQPRPRPTARRGGQAGGSALTAQMPGQIREVLVSQGEHVARGAALVILEAMKMEIRVSAPADGVVARLHVAKGDTVERGQPLVELE
jgi:3-methylcrotonyl-CoA carboxylase alpha subunit